jgi:hypothetical protein
LNHFDKFRDEIKIRIRLIFRVDVLMAIFPRNSSLIEKNNLLLFNENISFGF